MSDGKIKKPIKIYANQHQQKYDKNYKLNYTNNSDLLRIDDRDNCIRNKFNHNIQNDIIINNNKLIKKESLFTKNKKIISLYSKSIDNEEKLKIGTNLKFINNHEHKYMKMNDIKKSTPNEYKNEKKNIANNFFINPFIDGGFHNSNSKKNEFLNNDLLKENPLITDKFKYSKTDLNNNSSLHKENKMDLNTNSSLPKENSLFHSDENTIDQNKNFEVLGTKFLNDKKLIDKKFVQFKFIENNIFALKNNPKYNSKSKNYDYIKLIFYFF